MKHDRTLFVGLGSPHGDDQAGWLVAQQLASRIQRDQVEVRLAMSPVNVLDWLGDVQCLVVCDACHGLERVGAIRSWRWPTFPRQEIAWSGTHNFSLLAVLDLAESLGRLPENVVIWAIEGAVGEPMTQISTAVAEAIPKVLTQIDRQLNCDHSSAAKRRV